MKTVAGALEPAGRHCMGTSIRRIDYFNCTVRDRPGEAHQVLSILARHGVELLAFNAVPAGIDQTQLVLFPANVDGLVRAASELGLILTGPQHALMIQGDDELGALVDIHRRLFDAHVNVFASTGVADGRGGFGYLIYVRSEEFEQAAAALDL